MGASSFAATAREDFAFETTLSGLTYVQRLKKRKRAGYRIDIVYLRPRSVQLALRCIAARVHQGGHDVPRLDVIRRFTRGWETSRISTDRWRIHGRFTRTLIRRRSYWREGHESQDPRKKARGLFGRRRTRVTSSGQGRTQDGAYVRTPLYLWENGKVVAKKP